MKVVLIDKNSDRAIELLMERGIEVCKYSLIERVDKTLKSRVIDISIEI